MKTYNNKTGFSEDVQAILKHGSPLPENSDSISKEKDKSDKFIRISNPIYDNGISFIVGLFIVYAGMICFACLKDNDILGYYGVK